VRGVIEDEFGARKEGGSEDRIVNLNETCTLLGNGLEGIAIGVTGGDGLGRSLEKSASAGRNRMGFTLDGEKECRAAGHERRSHRRLDEI
jgi:hypothetical protein